MYTHVRHDREKGLRIVEGFSENLKDGSFETRRCTVNVVKEGSGLLKLDLECIPGLKRQVQLVTKFQ